MKHDLEGFREFILLINSILKWDKKYYPGIIFGLNSALFALLWYLDLSVLSLIAIILLALTVVDYVFPIISKIIFKAENWNGAQEKKFEEVCQEIVGIRSKAVAGYNSVFATKDEKSTMVRNMFMISHLEI